MLTFRYSRKRFYITTTQNALMLQLPGVRLHPAGGTTPRPASPPPPARSSGSATDWLEDSYDLPSPAPSVYVSCQSLAESHGRANSGSKLQRTSASRECGHVTTNLSSVAGTGDATEPGGGRRDLGGWRRGHGRVGGGRVWQSEGVASITQLPSINLVFHLGRQQQQHADQT